MKIGRREPRLGDERLLCVLFVLLAIAVEARRTLVDCSERQAAIVNVIARAVLFAPNARSSLTLSQVKKHFAGEGVKA
eukprot:6180878-Pleurochrysis_carterae.AAC.1